MVIIKLNSKYLNLPGYGSIKIKKNQKNGGKSMRTTSNYRPMGFNKLKTIFFTGLLLAVAFLSGAVVEKSEGFLQDMMMVAPVVLDEIREFFHEQFYIKVNTAAGCLKWGSIITLTIFEHRLNYLIRGP